MSLIDKPKVVYLCTICALVMFLYFTLYPVITHDPRMTDASLGVEEAKIWEVIILVSGLISTIVILLSSLNHAYKTKRARWRNLMMLMFPLSFIYAWKYGKKNENH